MNMSTPSARSVNRTDIICLCNYHGVGGAQLNAGMLTKAFRERGYDAQLGFLFEREPESNHGVDTAFVLAPRPPKSISAWKNFYAAYKIEVLARQPRAIFGFQPFSNLVGAWAASRVPDCRMIATQRNPADRQSRAVGALEAAVGSTGLYDGNIAVSHAVRDSFSGYWSAYRERMSVVHNATPPLPIVAEDQAQCRHALGVKSLEGGIVLGCLARLHPQKNLAFALSILPMLPDNVTLYLAGGGPMEGELRAQAERLGIEDRVIFMGPLTGPDITRFYRAVDIILFTSIYEGFGRVLVEAMSQGTPIISSDIPIAREVGDQAVIYRPFQPEAWAAAIRELASDLRFRTSLTERGKERAEQFGLSNMVTGYLNTAGL